MIGLRIFLDNIMSGDTVDGDDADEIDTVGHGAHVDGVGVLQGHHGAAVDVKDVDFLNAFGNDVEFVVDGVGIEDNVGVLGLGDTGGVTSGDGDVVDAKPVSVGDVVVAESNIDFLTSKACERTAVFGP